MVERATPNSSASSAVVWPPARYSSATCASWRGLSLGCFPRSRPLASAAAIPSWVRMRDEVCLELGDHGQHVEQQPADGVGWVVDRAAEVQLDLAGGQLVDDVAGVRQGPGEPIKFGDDKGVAGA